MEEIRQKIHACINRIRQIVSPLQLPDKKRDALFRKLNALADEVDRDRTKGEANFALALEIASVGGQAANKLKPVRELVDAITNLLGKAKEIMEEKLRLPAPTRKRAPTPKKQLPPPSSDFDGEIPF